MKKVYLAQDGSGRRHLFSTWSQCQAFVSGRPIPFVSGTGAEDAARRLDDLIQRGRATQRRQETPQLPGLQLSQPGRGKQAPRPQTGLCSDAGTHGNPGPCSIRVAKWNGEILLERDLGIHSNNYAELAGIEAMILLAGQLGETELWTDSQIALGWIHTGRVGLQVHEREAVLARIEKIQELLAKEPNLRLRKWHTRNWGEIPADFGRK